MNLGIEFVFKLRSVTAQQIASSVDLTPLRSTFQECVVGGQSFGLDDAIKFVSDSREYHFLITDVNDHAKISLASLATQEISVLRIEAVENLEEHLSGLASLYFGEDHFVSVRAFNKDYERVQNATSLSVLSRAGIDTSCVNMVSNGLPFPLEKSIVDTSSNPGRRELRVGYIEAIGHVMGFGKPLVAQLSLDVDRLREFGVVEQSSDGVMFFADQIFDDSADSQANQIQLRNILYRVE
jgi:hypothetical protein